MGEHMLFGSIAEKTGLFLSVMSMVTVVRMVVTGPSVGGTLGSLLGGTVGDEFSTAVSVSSGIRIGGVTADVEDVGIELYLVD